MPDPLGGEHTYDDTEGVCGMGKGGTLAAVASALAVASDVHNAYEQQQTRTRNQQQTHARQRVGPNGRGYETPVERKKRAVRAYLFLACFFATVLCLCALTLSRAPDDQQSVTMVMEGQSGWQEGTFEGCKGAPTRHFEVTQTPASFCANLTSDAIEYYSPYYKARAEECEWFPDYKLQHIKLNVWVPLAPASDISLSRNEIGDTYTPSCLHVLGKCTRPPHDESVKVQVVWSTTRDDFYNVACSLCPDTISSLDIDYECPFLQRDGYIVHDGYIFWIGGISGLSW